MQVMQHARSTPDGVSMHRLSHVVVADDAHHKSQAAVPEWNKFALNAAQHLYSESCEHVADFCCVSYATLPPGVLKSACGWVSSGITESSIELLIRQPASKHDAHMHALHNISTAAPMCYQTSEIVLPKFSLKGPALGNDGHFPLVGSFLFNQ